MRFLLVKIIDFYKKIISPFQKTLDYIGLLQGNSCVFYPTCSDYARQAFKKYGIFKGFFLSIWRILRCHPWQKNHIDPLK